MNTGLWGKIQLMQTVSESALPSVDEVSRWTVQDTLDRLLRDHKTALAHEQQIASLKTELQSLQQQFDWLRRQVFGQKSERRIPEVPAEQMHLGEMLGLPDQAPAPTADEQEVPGYKRKRAHKDFAAGERGDESNLFFDESRVPVKVIEVDNPETEGLTPDQYEVIGQKVSYRLAQQPGSYVVLKYVRPVVKRKDTQVLSCPPAPVGVIEGSRADVSLIAGVLTDKLQWHLPLYRQHQRMGEAGVRVSRGWLTDISAAAIHLLEPIYDAQLASIRRSRVKAIDETTIRAGRAGPGKMKTGYFWPIYGELDEVCFPFFESREHAHVEKILGPGQPPDNSVILSDGYSAYSAYAKKLGIEHAQCWAHCRREFVKAESVEPALAAEALRLIGEIYRVEDEIRGLKLYGERKREYRLGHSKGHVEAFFDWVQARLEDNALLPTNRLTGALGYAHNRRHALSLHLQDPDVAVDTNHLERTLRPVPLGRKNWLFAWTELGAKQIGIAQSLIITCQLHDIRPYDYLVDVLQRVSQHPASRVEELTPRLWKTQFANQRLRSPIETTG